MDVMRNSIAALILFSATASFASATQFSLSDDKTHSNIDPIVTGQRVTKAQYDRWFAARKLAAECPKCALSQAYPED